MEVQQQVLLHWPHTTHVVNSFLQNYLHMSGAVLRIEIFLGLVTQDFAYAVTFCFQLVINYIRHKCQPLSGSMLLWLLYFASNVRGQEMQGLGTKSKILNLLTFKRKLCRKSRERVTNFLGCTMAWGNQHQALCAIVHLLLLCFGSFVCALL